MVESIFVAIIAHSKLRFGSLAINAVGSHCFQVKANFQALKSQSSFIGLIKAYLQKAEQRFTTLAYQYFNSAGFAIIATV